MEGYEDAEVEFLPAGRKNVTLERTEVAKDPQPKTKQRNLLGGSGFDRTIPAAFFSQFLFFLPFSLVQTVIPSRIGV